uniref:Evasin n=1 Tax=Rhipicephalus appendiculatus TaxID=34631 RepID=A0A131Y942_RHIAP
MNFFYFLVAIVTTAVGLAAGTPHRIENSTTVQNMFNVTNSTTRDCRYVNCGEGAQARCRSGCTCFTGRGDVPFLCVSDVEAEFYKTGSSYV